MDFIITGRSWANCNHPWLNFQKWSNLRAVLFIRHVFFPEPVYPCLFQPYLSPISTTLCCFRWPTCLKWESLNPSCYVHSQHSTRFMSWKAAKMTNGGKGGQKGKQKSIQLWFNQRWPSTYTQWVPWDLRGHGFNKKERKCFLSIFIMFLFSIQNLFGKIYFSPLSHNNFFAIKLVLCGKVLITHLGWLGGWLGTRSGNSFLRYLHLFSKNWSAEVVAWGDYGHGRQVPHVRDEGDHAVGQLLFHKLVYLSWSPFNKHTVTLTLPKVTNFSKQWPPKWWNTMPTLKIILTESF